MSDRSGFGSSPIRYTAGVEFSPYADDLWYIVTVIGDGDSGMPSLVGPDYSEVYEFGGASGGNCDFIFRSPASLPAVICENYGEAIIDGSVQRASRIFDPHTVDPAALPENNRNIGTITVADDGVGAAFIEHEFAGGGVNRVLWVMSAAGADPVRVGLVDERIANVVRVGQFTF